MTTLYETIKELDRIKAAGLFWIESCLDEYYKSLRMYDEGELQFEPDCEYVWFRRFLGIQTTGEPEYVVLIWENEDGIIYSTKERTIDVFDIDV